MTVLTRLAIAAGLLGGLSGVAHAQLDNGATLQFTLFQIFENGGPVIPSDDIAIGRYFNAAHCECSKAGETENTDFQYTVSLSAPVTSNSVAEAWVGTVCGDEVQRPTTCRRVTSGDTSTLTLLSGNPVVRRFNYFDVLNGVNSDDTCQVREGPATFWYLVNLDQVGPYEHVQEIPLRAMGIDTAPPPIPDGLLATGGEQSVRLTWTNAAARFDDIEFFQAFCSVSGGQAVGNGSFTPRYQTTQDVCARPFTLAMTASPVAPSSQGTPVTAMPPELAQLDRAFLCGEAVRGSTELAIDGLDNGVEYTVALVTVDLEGNYSGTYFSSTVTPVEVTDLWEDIHDRDGGPQGGCLSTSRPGGGGPFGGLLVAGAIASAVRWRRRRKVALAAALVLAAGPAQADDFSPYWEQEEADDGTNLYQLDDVRWHIGIRVGPYIPDIDGQVGKNAGKGPYEAMFGNYFVNGDERTAYVWQVLPMFDVDYVLWRGFGQVTVGGSIGYMSQSALAYEAGSSPDDEMRPRATGNETVFRMVPTQLAVGYRFTYLADTYGIPIVPYARGGLAYYMWLMRAPNGDLSRTCNSETMGECPEADVNKAKGGSFGLVGSVGLAIRAEGIDRDSARSMRETGVEHAGFYAELSLGKVDGFGASDKLSLGDQTWFAGVDFEF